MKILAGGRLIARKIAIGSLPISQFQREWLWIFFTLAY
uniref:Uncharacterized protein n=1 Tax=Rhizophora mucronata TaxID=61149 RepID=A0A2P2PDX9_RHIMU